MFSKSEEMQGKLKLLKALEANDSSTIYATFDTYPFYQNDVDRLVKIIKTNTHMLALKLLGCNLTKEQTKEVAMAILLNNTLREVKIEGYKDDPAELKSLLTQVKSHVEENAAPRISPKL
jgi:hypothetical protein